MSCFWNGILQQLTAGDLKLLELSQKTPQQLVQALKKKVQKTPNVRWNGNPLSEKELDENLEHIRSYNVRTINHGYWCSTCEPFLLLLAELLKVHIHHNYCRAAIHYTFVGDVINDNIRTLKFGSNRGHFWSGHRGGQRHQRRRPPPQVHRRQRRR